GCVIVDLEFGGEDGLLALKEFRAALDGRDLQGATFANVILVVTQIFGSEGGLLLRSLLLELHDKNGVIEGMNLKSNFIFGVLQIVAGSGGFHSGNTIFLADTQQLGQGLGDHGAARKESLLALREERAAVGNGHTCRDTKSSSRDGEVLQFGDVQYIRLVGYGRQVIRTGSFFVVLVFLDLEASDLEGAVLLECKVNRFGEGEMTRFVC